MTQETQSSAESSAPVRAVIALTGAEARDLLQGLVTNSVLDAAPDRPRFTALLTPQGKILHTMFVWGAADGGLYLDVAADGADDLIRRLTLYRLRRKIGIEDLRGRLSVALGEGPPDPRRPLMPARNLVEGKERADWAGYEAARLALAIPDQGRDYGPEEIFPADANLDLLNGVDLKKGCFVGQEVVSRMYRKAGVRKRMCAIRFDGPAPEYGAAIADESGAQLGGVRSTGWDAEGNGIGIALVRIDRLAEARGTIAAGGTRLSVTPPPDPAA